MDSPTITVVLLAYQVAAFLPECLESVLPQLRDGDELLILEDGSTDGTAQLAAEAAERHPAVRVISQPHLGAGAARNRGIVEATGDYLLFVDGDDALAPGSIPAIARRIGASAPDFALFRFATWDGVRTPRPVDWPEILQGRDRLDGDDAELVLTSAWFPAWIAAWRRGLLLDQGIRNGEGYLIQDQEFVIHAALVAEHVELVDEPLYRYRSNPDSALRSPARAAHRIEGRRRSDAAILRIAGEVGASARARALIANHAFRDLVRMHYDDGLPRRRREEVLGIAADFLAGLDVVPDPMLQPRLAALVAHDALRRRDAGALRRAMRLGHLDRYAAAIRRRLGARG